MTLPLNKLPPISDGWDKTTKLVIAIVLMILFGIALYSFRVAFVPIIIGSITAYILTPPVQWICRTTKMPRGLATGLVYLLLILLIVPVMILLIPQLVEQGVIFWGQLLVYIESLSEIQTTDIVILGFTIETGDLVNQLVTRLGTMLGNAAGSTVGFVLDLVQTLIYGVFTFVIAFYLTRDGDKIVAAFQSLIPEVYREDAHLLMHQIDQVWRAFLRGQVILSFTVFVILTIVSYALGLPQPLLMGVWGGLLEFMPSIGNIIWGTTAILLAIIQGSTYLPLSGGAFIVLVLVVYIAFSQIDINILIPNIIGGQIQLHPLVVLLGVIIGLSVGGILGVALAAPTIASLRVIGQYIYARLFDLEPFPDLTESEE